MDVFYNEMEKNKDRISFVKSYQEIEDNMKNGKMSALLTLEEGGVCMGNIRLLRDFYRLGVRMMTLTWNFPNELGFPAKVTEGRRRIRTDRNWNCICKRDGTSGNYHRCVTSE